jgi:hypothetical protein
MHGGVTLLAAMAEAAPHSPRSDELKPLARTWQRLAEEAPMPSRP